MLKLMSADLCAEVQECDANEAENSTADDPHLKILLFKHYIQWDVEVVVPVKMVHPAGVKAMAIAPAADVTG